MLNKKQLIIALAIFMGVYLFLILPDFGMAAKYADFYRKQAYTLFHEFGDNGFVVLEPHEDNGSDDTRLYLANKTLADQKGNVSSAPFNISTRILGYLPSALLLALFAATPIKWWKRFALMGAGFLILQVFLMGFLYFILLDMYIKTSWLKMYQDLGNSSKKFVSYISETLIHGMGLNNFLVVMIWLGLVVYFERNIIASFLNPSKSA